MRNIGYNRTGSFKCHEPSLVGPSPKKKDTNFRLSLSVEEKLQITLRYLVTGAAFRVLAFHFMRGETTMGKVIEETTETIWKCLNKQYLTLPSEHNIWIVIAQRYEELWNMPNCIGSIDGKHVRIKAPAKSGSVFYHSIVLMAIANA
ncbi:protein ANTAGONIST OF LIKE HETEROCHROMATIN PROTEIN 1-like [Photinus pyralis]|uniref:protein ANTAGONIST OF LIKE HETEROCHROMATIN PROTEIN 1-like n=1 Tax=Photinus pyralis TaxID=7054 RepID=UPI0012674B13|nr:protein ANTAGONIST OF LIKE HETEROCHROMATIN PROTEIN 1-like [Photinus pyralis]